MANGAAKEGPVPGPKRFVLGKVVATPGAAELVMDGPEDARAILLLSRHACRDWGDVGEFDWAQNDVAVGSGGRILSAYETSGGRVWIITEADRSATTFLLPNEY